MKLKFEFKKYNMQYVISNLRFRSRGFTLIELLVIMAVIGTLAAVTIGIVNPLGQFQKQRDGQRKNDLAQVQRALEVYYNDFGHYPAANALSVTLSVIFDGSNRDWGTAWTPYATVLPKDPVSSQKYRYFVSANRQQYWIYAHLERNTDSQFCIAGGTTACTGANSVVTNLATYPCGPTAAPVCNYGVSSPNASP